VTFDSTIYCGQCRFCRAGETNLCDDRRVLGVSCDEYRQHGAFAQFVAVPQHILYPLPDELSFEQAALIEPTSIAVHAVNRTPIRLGDTAVVVGAGMIGLLCVQALRTAGCAKIIAVDLDSRRLEIARQLGADHVVRSEGDATLGRVFELTDGRGADVAVEAVGIAATVQLGVECLRKGGHLSLIGNLASTVELPLQAVVTRELTLYGSCASRGDYPSCLDLIARGAIRVDPLISARAPLAEGPSWFTRLRDGSEGLMKVVLEPQNS